MSYRAPLAEMAFCAGRIVGQDRLAATARFAEATPDTRAAILEEAAKLCEDVLAPLNRAGDLHPARLENGVVRCAPGFGEAYRAIARGGWVGMIGDPEWGGMGLPLSLATCVNEMMASASLALSLNPMLTMGAIEALERHASAEIKARYLPALNAGTWTGTMNLTESQAGSDVGASTSRAEPNGDGSHAITGQKIFISWGDHDLAENICHLVLARLPDAAPGTRGLSLFLVPKYIPDGGDEGDGAGSPGVANALRPVSLEHKLGLHGSPTAVMEYDRATGWLIGAEHGGMAAMFTMMNNARLGVGVEGLAIAELATQKAVAFALERRQGRTPDNSPGIAGHADVRRMLLTMRTLTNAARAICHDCAFSLDMARAAGSDDARETHARRAAFLTPIAKAFGTDTGIEVANLAVQVHGGMGYIEETGIAQLLRDVRVTAIYEGTNGIQAMDLVGRKLSVDRGAMARSMLAEIAGTGAALAQAGGAPATLADGVLEAAEAARRATEWMLAASEPNDRNAGATPYLRLLALALGAHYLGRGALAAHGTADAAARLALARFFVAQIAPQTAALARAATAGAAPLYAIGAARLGA
ncbi:MAG TPA: acyl-CoA dehydrogenase family protein [Thermohalobaculum sp.]|nr:acyl-CoA dehydrogenase family protein [Thermohalobaculum sp.]